MSDFAGTLKLHFSFVKSVFIVDSPICFLVEIHSFSF